MVLTIVDTLRADRLSSYGSARVETPHMDALATEGIRFTNAASAVPFTLPAHGTIMTGTYPPYHGVRENVGCYLDESVPTLAEILSGAGYLWILRRLFTGSGSLLTGGLRLRA